MKVILLSYALLAACSTQPYTWGDTVEQLAEIYCRGQELCGGDPASTDLCAEHTAWHLCAADGTCAVELEQSTAEGALLDCERAVAQVDDTDCYLLGVWGVLPSECEAVFELAPVQL